MVQRFIENKLGLPSLGDAKDTLNAVNSVVQALDKEKLRMVSSIINGALKLQQQGGTKELTEFTSAIRLISCMPAERMDRVAGMIADIRGTADSISKLIKSLPPGMMEGLNLGEMVREVKKEMGK